jgi:hypothetical protein
MKNLKLKLDPKIDAISDNFIQVFISEDGEWKIAESCQETFLDKINSLYDPNCIGEAGRLEFNIGQEIFCLLVEGIVIEEGDSMNFFIDDVDNLINDKFDPLAKRHDWGLELRGVRIVRVSYTFSNGYLTGMEVIVEPEEPISIFRIGV